MPAAAAAEPWHGLATARHPGAPGAAAAPRAGPGPSPEHSPVAPNTTIRFFSAMKHRGRSRGSARVRSRAVAPPCGPGEAVAQPPARPRSSRTGAAERRRREARLRARPIAGLGGARETRSRIHSPRRAASLVSSPRFESAALGCVRLRSARPASVRLRSARPGASRPGPSGRGLTGPSRSQAPPGSGARVRVQPAGGAGAAPGQRRIQRPSARFALSHCPLQTRERLCDRPGGR